jgi:hypothetical protein
MRRGFAEAVDTGKVFVRLRVPLAAALAQPLHALGFVENQRELGSYDGFFE